VEGDTVSRFEGDGPFAAQGRTEIRALPAGKRQQAADAAQQQGQGGSCHGAILEQPSADAGFIGRKAPERPAV
jgi:hypothetical protein